MQKKRDNNLVCINIGTEKYYYTSARKAGLYLGLQSASVLWAIRHRNKLITNDDRIATITLEDGSDIPYKYINNDLYESSNNENLQANE